MVSRFTDTLLAFPFLVLAVGLAAILGPSLLTATVAIGVAGIPAVVRVTRSETLRLRGLDFVAAAVADGASDLVLLRRHILPNAVNTLIVQATVAAPAAIIGEAVLSFLGLGIRPPAPSLGRDAGQRPAAVPGRPVAGGLPRRLHRGRHAGAQPARRRPARRARPAGDAAMTTPADACSIGPSDLDASGSAPRTGRCSPSTSVSFEVAEREVLALVGESGCGKSVTAMALTRLLPRNALVTGSVRLGERSLLDLPESRLRDVRGRDIAYVFQEPMTSLNPVLTVGRQIGEVLRRHQRHARRGRATGARPNCSTWSASRCRRGGCGEYPHQLSGGMRQRVMIAMAVACRPRLLVADEPTTALDVTVQAGILDVLRDLRAEIGTAVLLITHDLGVVADIADRVVVMYAGRTIEEAGTEALFARHSHPYTRGLLEAVPNPARHADGGLREIPGRVPTHARVAGRRARSPTGAATPTTLCRYAAAAAAARPGRAPGAAAVHPLPPAGGDADDRRAGGRRPGQALRPGPGGGRREPDRRRRRGARAWSASPAAARARSAGA